MQPFEIIACFLLGGSLAALAFERHRQLRNFAAADAETVRSWQRSIIGTATRKLGRPLSTPEERFITSRRAFIALEMISDTVGEADRSELAAYLNSES